MAEWQPIETAPKDGTPILAYLPYDWAATSHRPALAVIRWDERCDCWFFPIPGNYIQGAEIPPTHWQPLPDPPEGGRVEGRR